NIKVGYDVEVTFDALPDQVFTGKVIEVMPSLVTVQGSSMIEGLAYIQQAAPDHPLGAVTHHHGQDDHLAYLERPFHKAHVAIQRRASHG
ncbi:MAG: efflux RND transporter periplasmic adaptor subunit, partial [Anaerolineales bacterium]|nr:efflux RND transporter periplasmic adaptor subunit [Anaerolineales bacterium]